MDTTSIVAEINTIIPTIAAVGLAILLVFLVGQSISWIKETLYGPSAYGVEYWDENDPTLEGSNAWVEMMTDRQLDEMDAYDENEERENSPFDDDAIDYFSNYRDEVLEEQEAEYRYQADMNGWDQISDDFDSDRH